MAAIENVLNELDQRRSDALKRLFEFLEIPSVSTDPVYASACDRAAEWLCRQLTSLGFEASVRPTSGRSMVVGHARTGRKDVPRALFYGHYDVQPPDPLDLWVSPPFSPQLVEAAEGARIVARGASDDKGQVMTFIEACRAFVAAGGMPCDVTFLFEGEEETGSPSLPGFLAENGAELAADVALVCDTNMWNRQTPAITTMLRGLLLEEVIIHCASRDLHSGMFGGPALNPVRVLARILADLHDERGRVAVPGFYDGVDEIPEEIAAQWRALDFDERKFLASVGLATPAGEENRSVLEQIWARPTCDVNGIVGGYTGVGSKTVLPAQASAKVSFRLVGRQDPERIRESFRAFVRERLHPDAKVEFAPHGGSPALTLPIASEALTRVRRALHQEWGREAALVGSGGSIPIVGAFKRELGMDALMIGFALDDDRIHSPNEKYDVMSFHKGARSWARILHALAL